MAEEQQDQQKKANKPLTFASTYNPIHWTLSDVVCWHVFWRLKRYYVNDNYIFSVADTFFEYFTCVMMGCN